MVEIGFVLMLISIVLYILASKSINNSHKIKDLEKEIKEIKGEYYD